MKNYTLITPCFFGIEKILKNEITNLGYEIIKTEDGRVTYRTDEKGIATSNIWLRTAERVLLKVAEFEAKTFNVYLKIQKLLTGLNIFLMVVSFQLLKHHL
ncbi:putative methylase domain protein [[Clostridium] sordellii ATCC 9714]|nr:putative methylase domain protein [[Clostridium] sordellii ATCC 9714] [Paeniclostridium sordellii ATCC 9714]